MAEEDEWPLLTMLVDSAARAYDSGNSQADRGNAKEELAALTYGLVTEGGWDSLENITVGLFVRHTECRAEDEGRYERAVTAVRQASVGGGFSGAAGLDQWAELNDGSLTAYITGDVDEVVGALHRIVDRGVDNATGVFRAAVAVLAVFRLIH